MLSSFLNPKKNLLLI